VSGNRFDLVGYLYDKRYYCVPCMKGDDDGGDVEVSHIKAVFRGTRHAEGYTCTVCCEPLVTKKQGKTFEVSIVFKGQRNYIVEAPDSETAKDFAHARYSEGELGESTGSEYQEIENVSAKEVP
jgi:hypothetical protein